MSPWAWLGDERATQARRETLRALLGPLPALDAPPRGVLIESRELGFARCERWRLQLNREEEVPALLLLPADRDPTALVVYCHAHGNRFEMGKDELLCGRPALSAPPYGELLPSMGLAVLAIDHWCFGERAQRSERAFVKRLLWDGCSLWGYRVHDTLAALDWLRLQARFAALPCAAMGLSMGSTMAIWAAALRPDIDACIDLCCLAEFDDLVRTGQHDLHGEYFFVPGLRREFSAAEIAGLIAPRPHLSLAGRHDPLTPPAGLESVDRALRRAYTTLNAADAWRQEVFDVGHQESPQMRARVLATLDRLVRRRGFRQVTGWALSPEHPLENP